MNEKLTRAFRFALFGGVTLAALHWIADRAYPASRMTPATAHDTPWFPTVTASNLEGQSYTLPRDFEGECTLCLIAFTREQQADIDTWLAGIQPMAQTPGFHYYEIPVISTSTPVFRKFLDTAMVQGIPGKAQRERTITLYLDKAAFRKALNLPTESTIYAILVGRDGEILWRTEGRFTPEKGEALRALL